MIQNVLKRHYGQSQIDSKPILKSHPQIGIKPESFHPSCAEAADSELVLALSEGLPREQLREQRGTNLDIPLIESSYSAFVQFTTCDLLLVVFDGTPRITIRSYPLSPRSSIVCELRYMASVNSVSPSFRFSSSP